MSINRIISRQKIFFSMILVMSLVSACQAQRSSQFFGETPATITTKKNSSQTIATTAAITKPPCLSSMTSVNTLVNDKKIDEYLLSSNGQHLYVKSNNSWWDYLPTNNKLMSLPDLSIMSTPTESDVEQSLLSILGIDRKIVLDHSAPAPDRKKLIYWEVSNLKDQVVPTATPDELSNESAGGVQIDNDIFLLEEGMTHLIYLGQISGGIKSVHWVTGGDRVVLEMLSFSPYYLWLIDVSSRSLTPLLSQADVASAPQFALLDIDSNGEWLLYQSSRVDYVSAININNRTIKPLYTVKRSFGSWWLLNAKQFITVQDDTANSYSIDLYDLNTMNTTRLFSDIKVKGSFSLVNISNDKAILANIKHSDTDGYDIYILSICINNQ